MFAAASSETASSFVQLGAIILGLSVLARLAGRLRVSPIPLYLLGGLVFGVGGILPVHATEDFIDLVAEIGVLLLLFTLGLEYTPRELSTELRRSALGGVVDLVANFTPGLLAGFLLGWSPVAAILLGGCTYISSSGVIAKLLDDLGRIGNRETSTILSILVLEDLAMAVYLPIIGVLLSGAAFMAGVVSVAVALAVVALILAAAVRFGPTISTLLDSESDEVVMLSALGLVLLVGGLAQQAQVSAAIGAFLVGLAVSGPAQHHAAQLITPLRDLFAAIFFFVFALGIDPGSLPPVLAAAVLLAVVTSLTKIGVGWWAAGRAGVKIHGRWRAGTMLIPRGEFSIVIAGLGVAGGIEEELGPFVAAYVLVLAVAGPLIARADRAPVLVVRGRDRLVAARAAGSLG
jgi:CPA2 family monovalent cation:H+ antiporter-2